MGGSELQSMWRGMRVSCVLIALALAGCNAFDRGYLTPPMGGAGGMGGMGGDGADAGGEDASVCTPATEVCNGIDEDCDGVSDEEDPDALVGCEAVVVHARVRCASTTTSQGPTTLCANTACDPGWSTCDGIPSNGCETEGDSCQPCLTCEDAGEEDGGE